jgi:hypothetical protein
LIGKFGQGDMQLLIVVSSPDGFDSAAARAVGAQIADRLRGSPHVASVTSAWTSPPAAAAELVSKDRKSGLIVAGISGEENLAQPVRVGSQRVRDELDDRGSDFRWERLSYLPCSTPRACQTTTRSAVSGQFRALWVHWGGDGGGDPGATSGRGVDSEVPADG